ncbi:MAG: hypothetical protein K2X91_13305, partial [Thermoleophilia bacterium]|nr:hypothetical protein [Thermoleophilia bacterium]
CDQRLVPDRVFTPIGLAVLVAIPCLVLSAWWRGQADVRLLAAPHLMVLAALAPRFLAAG